MPNVPNTNYIYNVTAAKWVSYSKADAYDNQTGFLTLTNEKTEGAYFKFDKYSGDNYQISPYHSAAPATKYLNWYKGAGNSNNPADGNITIGLWQDAGPKDAGSRWTFSQVDNIRTYILSSAGMPATATITINGQAYTGVNAQGDTKFSAETLDPRAVSVSCGGGYGYTIIVDNTNNQVNVDFVLFIEKLDAQGLYYIYDVKAQQYLTYTTVGNDALKTAQAGSRVQLAHTQQAAKT